MAQLAEAIAHITARELDHNEEALAAAFPPSGNNPTAEAQEIAAHFVLWCEQLKVRSCPAKPTTVAAYVQWNTDQGVQPEKIIAALSAIEALHNCFGAANPVATVIVDNVLESIIDVKPPRGWRKEEKFSFALLPAMVRAAIARREEDREKEIRRLQNQTAQER